MAVMRARTRPNPIDPWRVVQRRHLGLLRYARARGAVAQPVLYTVWDRRIYVRLPVYNDACNFVDRADLALDVDASSSGRILIARVTGMGLLVPETTMPTALAETLETWPEGLPTRVLVLVPESVQHIPVADDVRYPPLPSAGSLLPGTYAV
ncbi:MAG TPA: hypothetical protein VIT65_05865 [Microlunatus sp.]